MSRERMGLIYLLQRIQPLGKAPAITGEWYKLCLYGVWTCNVVLCLLRWGLCCR